MLFCLAAVVLVAAAKSNEGLGPAMQIAKAAGRRVIAGGFSPPWKCTMEPRREREARGRRGHPLGHAGAMQSS